MKNFIQKCTIKKVILTFLGVVLIGVGISILKLSKLGVDPFTCLNTGLSQFTGLSFGTVQLLVNIVLFILMLILTRYNIGIGTLFSLFVVGYTCDIFMWLYENIFKIPVDSIAIWAQILLLPLGIFIVCFGVALYVAPELGFAPYEGLNYIIVEKAGIKFQVNRVITDCICVIIGGVFLYLASGWNDIFKSINICTLIMALVSGPLINILKVKIADPIVGNK